MRGQWLRRKRTGKREVSIFIRTASERDLPAVQKLLGICLPVTYDSIYGAARVSAIINELASLPALKLMLLEPYSEFIVADGAGGILGMAYANQSANDYVMLRRLYVLPEAQGKGLGSELLAEIETAFPDARSARLEVEEANTIAVRFYKRHDYIIVSQFDDFGGPQSGIAAFNMQKQLA